MKAWKVLQGLEKPATQCPSQSRWSWYHDCLVSAIASVISGLQRSQRRRSPRGLQSLQRRSRRNRKKRSGLAGSPCAAQHRRGIRVSRCPLRVSGWCYMLFVLQAGSLKSLEEG